MSAFFSFSHALETNLTENLNLQSTSEVPAIAQKCWTICTWRGSKFGLQTQKHTFRKYYTQKGLVVVEYDLQTQQQQK